MISYTVEESSPFTVRIFDTDVNNSVPFILQPHDEFGVNWESFIDAENWAKSFIENYVSKPSVTLSEEETIKLKLTEIGLTVEDIRPFL
jgi:hypothetical protein